MAQQLVRIMAAVLRVRDTDTRAQVQRAAIDADWRGQVETILFGGQQRMRRGRDIDQHADKLAPADLADDIRGS